MAERTMMNECYSCVHKESIPVYAHIRCKQPDDHMTGNAHGIKNGWFVYPHVYDPVWKTKLCDNYWEKEV